MSTMREILRAYENLAIDLSEGAGKYDSAMRLNAINRDFRERLQRHGQVTDARPGKGPGRPGR